MSFVDHLEELRWHIIRAVLSILVCAIVVFIYHAWVFENIIMGPTRQSYRDVMSLVEHAGRALEEVLYE